ncbi:hypothetical protein D3C84_1105410 [compost metagenome]
MTPDVREALINGQIHAVISENEQQWGNQIIEQLLAAARNVPSSNWVDTGFVEIQQSDMANEY